jgi:hypothetical protein
VRQKRNELDGEVVGEDGRLEGAELPRGRIPEVRKGRAWRREGKEDRPVVELQEGDRKLWSAL